MPDAPQRIAVVGGGIAGLAAAFRARRLGHEVQLFEAAPHVGGAIRSTRTAGFLVEHGPNSLQARTPALEAALEGLGLGAAVVEASPAARKRFVVKDGVPRPIPTTPAAFFRTPLLSPKAKVRLFGEPFVRRDPAGESVADFFERRLGPEVLAALVDPFVAGIYAGDPERLSLRHTFPRLHALERDHGSLLRGALAQRRAQRKTRGGGPPRRGLFSFREGLQTLPDAFARVLGEAVQTECLVMQVTPPAGGAARWQLRVDAGGTERTVEADAVVAAVPLHHLPGLGLVAGAAAEMLGAVEHPPVTVVATGYRRAQVAHALDGFGMLVPSSEPGVRILGTLFVSSLFPDRAPEGHVLLSTFVGGTRHPADAHLPEGRLFDLVGADLARLLGVEGPPVFARAIRWPRAIPQYAVGYEQVLDVLDQVEGRYPTVAFAGSYRGGVSVGDALASGYQAAERLATVAG